MQKIRLYSSRRLFCLFVLAALAIAVTIFCFSAEPATESADRSTGLAAVLLRLVYSDLDGLSDARQTELLLAADHFLRKTAHFCVYAAFGFFICLASLGFSRAWLLHTAYTLLIGASYAASDEIHQMLVPGRGPAVTDVLLDSTGVLAGALFALAVAHFLCKNKKSLH